MPFSNEGTILLVSPRVHLPRGWAEEGVWWEIRPLRLVLVLSGLPLLTLRALSTNLFDSCVVVKLQSESFTGLQAS